VIQSMAMSVLTSTLATSTYPSIVVLAVEVVVAVIVAMVMTPTTRGFVPWVRALASFSFRHLPNRSQTRLVRPPTSFSRLVSLVP
jgi:hypothetical protein